MARFLESYEMARDEGQPRYPDTHKSQKPRPRPKNLDFFESENSSFQHLIFTPSDAQGTQNPKFLGFEVFAFFSRTKPYRPPYYIAIR